MKRYGFSKLNFPKLLLIMVMITNLYSVYSDDVADVNTLLDKIERVYVEKNAVSIADCISDNFIAAVDTPNNPAGATVFNKIILLGMMVDILSKGTNQQFTRQFVQREIELFQNGAFIEASTLDKLPNNQIRIMDGYWITMKENNTWRIVFSIPRFFRSVAMIKEVFPSTQGERLGLRPGDIITFYCDKEINKPYQVVNTVKQHSNDTPGKKLLLKISRGIQDLQFQLDPGTIGVKMEKRLLPDKGSQMIGADQNHPIKDAARKMFESLIRLDSNALLSEIGPEGCLIFSASEGVIKAQFIKPPDNEKKLASYIQSSSQSIKNLKWEKMRAIVKGNLGFVAIQISFEYDNKMIQDTDIYVFAQQNGRWLYIADLPVMVTSIGVDLN